MSVSANATMTSSAYADGIKATVSLLSECNALHSAHHPHRPSLLSIHIAHHASRSIRQDDHRHCEHHGRGRPRHHAIPTRISRMVLAGRIYIIRVVLVTH